MNKQLKLFKHVQTLSEVYCQRIKESLSTGSQELNNVVITPMIYINPYLS